MKAKILLACALLFLCAGLVRAQQPDQDPIGQNFFAPDLVIQHQEEIGLSDEQKTYLKTEIRQAQVKFTEWQWKLQDEVEKMASLVKQPHVEEARRSGATGKGVVDGARNQAGTGDSTGANKEQADAGATSQTCGDPKQVREQVRAQPD